MHKLDHIDIQIANLLVDDGRMSSAEIARRVGNISERAARYRIERMIREDVIQVHAIARPEALGYIVRANVQLQIDADAISEVARRLLNYSCITHVSNAIGETDISLFVVGRDAAEIYEFVTQVVGKIPGVRKTSTSIVPKVLKGSYEWKFPLDNNLGCLPGD